MKKKVCILVNSLYTFGGEQNVSLALARVLAARPDYEVTLLSVFKLSDKIPYSLPAAVCTAHIFEYRFSPRRHPLKFVFGLRKFFKSQPIQDLLVASVGYSAFLLSALPKGTKTVYWDHQGFSVGGIFGMAWFGRRFAARFGDAVVAITRKNFDEYKRRLNPHGRLEMIYHGMDFKDSEIPYAADSKQIISCGRLDPQKGFDMLVDVAAIVLNRHPDWVWHIYGDGGQRALLEKKISDAGLDGRLILKGYCPDLEGVYSGYSFYVLTSRHEGLPVVLIEAISKKLPIVAFNCPSGPDEIVSDGESGIIVQCFDIPKMAAEICGLIEDAGRRKRFSDAAALRCRLFSTKAFGEKWVALIDSLLS